MTFTNQCITLYSLILPILQTHFLRNPQQKGKLAWRGEADVNREISNRKTLCNFSLQAMLHGWEGFWWKLKKGF